MAVVGLQKRPILSIVLKVRFIEVLEFGTITVGALLLGDDDIGMTVVAVGAGTLDAVIVAFTAAIFAFKLNVFLPCFFFWKCFPRPGPGILSVMY